MILDNSSRFDPPILTFTQTNTKFLIELYLAAYGVPIIILIGELEAIFTFCVFYSLRSGIGKTTKLLFITLTSFDITATILFYGLNIFGDLGIGLLISNSLISLPSVNNVLCKSIRGTGFFALHCLNWIYVLINIERLVAIKNPHLKNSVLSVKMLKIYNFLLIMIGVISGIFTANLYQLRSVFSFRRFDCSVNTSNFFNWLSFRIFIALDIYIGPNILSLIISLCILLLIWKQQLKRRQLGKQHQRSKRKTRNSTIRVQFLNVKRKQIYDWYYQKLSFDLPTYQQY